MTGTQLGQQEVVEPGMLLPRSRRDAGDRHHQAPRASEERAACTLHSVYSSCSSQRNFRDLTAPC